MLRARVKALLADAQNQLSVPPGGPFFSGQNSARRSDQYLVAHLGESSQQSERSKGKQTLSGSDATSIAAAIEWIPVAVQSLVTHAVRLSACCGRWMGHGVSA